MSAAVYARDRQTVRTVAGVRVRPGHWAAQSVHAFRTWTGERVIETWCGVSVDLTEGGAQTAETITCQTCANASWLAFRDGLRFGGAP